MTTVVIVSKMAALASLDIVFGARRVAAREPKHRSGLPRAYDPVHDPKLSRSGDRARHDSVDGHALELELGTLRIGLNTRCVRRRVVKHDDQPEGDEQTARLHFADASVLPLAEQL